MDKVICTLTSNFKSLHNSDMKDYEWDNVPHTGLLTDPSVGFMES